MANENNPITTRQRLERKPARAAILPPVGGRKREPEKTTALGQVDRDQTPVVDAIFGLVSEAQLKRDVLDVSRAATRLAKVHGGDSREMAVLITDAGLRAHINMDLSMPGPLSGALVRDRSGEVGGTTDNLR